MLGEIKLTRQYQKYMGQFSQSRKRFKGKHQVLLNLGKTGAGHQDFIKNKEHIYDDAVD